MLKLKPNIFTSQLLAGKYISVQSHHGLSIYVKVIRVNTYINKDIDKLTKKHSVWENKRIERELNKNCR